MYFMPTTSAAIRALAALVLLIVVAVPMVEAASNARVIVTYRDDPSVSERDRAFAASAEGGRVAVQRLAARLEKVAQRRGMVLRAHRAITENSQVVVADGIDSAALARQLSADPDVESAVVDRRVRPMATVPNEQYFQSGGVNGPAAGQWYLRAPTSTFVSAIDAMNAWDVTRGNARVIVAVLDTGVRFEHPDLGRVVNGGKLLDGYDFVSALPQANDNSGRDTDASDPGDWITFAEDNTPGNFYQCSVPDAFGNYSGSDSSWHGTQVAGIVGALTNNGVGMAGAGWNTHILPVRVLGKCGGYVSDVVVGMRWAAGLSVPGVTTNPNPAKVLNLSLGTAGACGDYQSAVNAVVAAGAVVIAAAGNTNGHAVGAPANCTNVISVGGLRHTGTKVGFSDLGPAVSISAPAGNCVNSSGICLYPLLTTTNAGTTGPAASTYTNGQNNITVGTSFSAPLVSATAALIRAVYPAVTPAQVLALLKNSSRPFPTTGANQGTPQCTAPQFDANGDPIDQDECYCTTSTCGAGMLDARAATQAARTQALAASGVQALVNVSPAYPIAGQTITLDANGTLFSGGASLANASWELLSGSASGPVPASGAQTTLSTTSSTTLQVRLTVTDSLGRTSALTQSIFVARDPAAPSEGGGGGGALGGPAYLLALALAVGAAWRLSAGRDA